MPRLFTLAALPLLIGVAPAAPVPEAARKPLAVYFPTAVGTKWVYSDGPDEYTFVVAKSEPTGGVRLVRVDLVRCDGGTQHHRTVEVGPRGLRETENFDRRLDPPLPLLRLPHTPGEAWEAPLTLDGDPRGTVRMTAGEVETVEVPAGTYRALRVDSVNADVGQRISSWYAPGVGLVRVDYRGRPTRDLKSFTPGKP